MRVIDGSTSNTATLQVYEAKTVKAVSESRKKQLESLKEQIESLQKEFTAMSAMEDFRGNGATAIKEFYKAHATIADHWIRFLQARIAFLDQVADDQEEKDLGGETAVVMPFLTGDLQTAHYRSIEMVSQQQDDLQRIFDSISDILPLNVFSKAAFTAHMEDANEGRKDTMKATQELDQQLAGEYSASGGEIENIIGLMNGLMEATRSGNDISPVHFNSSDFLNSEAYRNREEISARTEEYIGFKKEQKEQREIIAEMEALENRSAWEKLWDTTKTFTGELTGYYDYLRAEKGIDPVTGEKLTTTQRVAAGSMAAAGYIPVIGWFGKGIKGAKAIHNTARASNAAAHALDAYRSKEAMSFVSMGEKGIYGLIAANEAKGYLTGTDLLGEEVSEDSQGLNGGLSLAAIVGAGRLVRSGNVGVVSGRGVVNVNHSIRTYRNADLNKLEKKYIADPRITVEMPYVGKGKPGTNSEGWLRDKDYYWKEIMIKQPESLSKANKQKIGLGFSPVNDKTFREQHPQYDIKELYNDKLIHHHVGGGGQAVAVPSKLHPGTGGIHNAEKAAGIWGNDSEYAELLEKFLNK